MTYTPGPWGFNPNHRNGATIYRKVNGDAREIARVRKNKETDANAQLIAAAPKMADAIRFVLEDANTELDYEARLILERALADACAYKHYQDTAHALTKSTGEI